MQNNETNKTLNAKVIPATKEQALQLLKDAGDGYLPFLNEGDELLIIVKPKKDDSSCCACGGCCDSSDSQQEEGTTVCSVSVEIPADLTGFFMGNKPMHGYALSPVGAVPGGKEPELKPFVDSAVVGSVTGALDGRTFGKENPFSLWRGKSNEQLKEALYERDLTIASLHEEIQVLRAQLGTYAVDVNPAGIKPMQPMPVPTQVPVPGNWNPVNWNATFQPGAFNQAGAFVATESKPQDAPTQSPYISAVILEKLDDLAKRLAWLEKQFPATEENFQ